MLGAGHRVIDLNRKPGHPPLCLPSFTALDIVLEGKAACQVRLSLFHCTFTPTVPLCGTKTTSSTRVLCFSFLFPFPFLAFHLLHISGPRCTGRILRGSTMGEQGFCLPWLEAHIGLGRKTFIRCVTTVEKEAMDRCALNSLRYGDTTMAMRAQSRQR